MPRPDQRRSVRSVTPTGGSRTFRLEGAGVFVSVCNGEVGMTKQDKAAYDKKYRERHREHLKSIRDRWRSLHPFHMKLSMVRQRCNDPQKDSYKFYGGKGIRCFLTAKEIETLWDRDHAWKLKWPSLDRIDSSQNYTFENCRFIEISENVRRAHPMKTNCKHGHSLDDENTLIRHDGYRECRACRREIYKRWHQRQKVLQ